MRVGMNPVLGFGRDNPKRKLAGVTPRRFWFAKLRRSRFRLVKTGRRFWFAKLRRSRFRLVKTGRRFWFAKLRRSTLPARKDREKWGGLYEPEA
jgi:hypothetical protein